MPNTIRTSAVALLTIVGLAPACVKDFAPSKTPASPDPTPATAVVEREPDAATRPHREPHRPSLTDGVLDFEFISLDSPITDAPRPRLRSADMPGTMERPPVAMLMVQVPSLDDDRLWFHEQMLGVLFHPHTQPPDVALLLSCTCDTSTLGLRRYGYVTDGRVAHELAGLLGEFAVLLLDRDGRVLLRANDRLTREQVHEALDYREPPPGPRDRGPLPGPIPGRK